MREINELEDSEKKRETDTLACRNKMVRQNSFPFIRIDDKICVFGYIHANFSLFFCIYYIVLYLEVTYWSLGGVCSRKVPKKETIIHKTKCLILSF